MPIVTVPALPVSVDQRIESQRLSRSTSLQTRFADKGAAGVGAIAKGPGRKPSIPARTVAEVVRLTDKQLPADGSTLWSKHSWIAMPSSRAAYDTLSVRDTLLVVRTYLNQRVTG
jgi:hypothetical protein